MWQISAHLKGLILRNNLMAKKNQITNQKFRKQSDFESAFFKNPSGFESRFFKGVVFCTNNFFCK